MNSIDENAPAAGELIENVADDEEDAEEEQSSKKIPSSKMSLIQMKIQNSNELLNFYEILQLFNTAISEEQAWAVLYQVLVGFRTLMDSNLAQIGHNLDKIDIYLLNFAKDGSITFNFPVKNNVDAFQDFDRDTVESKVLTSIAYLIFDALDYGNNQSSEPDLHSSLSNLLIFISGHCKEFCEEPDDEGYDHDDEENTPTLDKAIEICEQNVNEPDYHYKAVCRGLYAQAYELKAFLAKIEDSKQTIKDDGKDTTKYCFEILDKTDWAKIWMQVINELRHGVKLRKVIGLPETRRHIEYELTPFEILLDQIRAKQYHLKKVSLDSSLAPEIKKSARDIILEFIRSRPPLRKSSLRKLNTSKSFTYKPQPNLHEQLMDSIRNYSTPLRKTQVQCVKLDEVNESKNDSKNESKRRIVKADKKLLNNLNSSDTDVSDIDDDELNNLPILQEEHEDMEKKIMKSLIENMQTNNKKRIKAPDSLRSPLAPWRNPADDEWKNLISEDLKPDTKINRRHTMNFSDLNRLTSSISAFNIFNRSDKAKAESVHKHENDSFSFKHSKVSDKWQLAKSRLTNPVYYKSGPGYCDFGYVSSHDLIKKLTSNKKKECVRLTFEELCHIRQVLTKADLDYLLFDNKIYYDVSRGKVCFSCRKTRFHLFNWGTKCRICQQKICKKCLQNAQLRNGLLVRVPLTKLSSNSQSKNDSASNSSDNDDYEIISTNNDDSMEFNQDSFSDSTSVLSYQANQNIDICTDCYQLMGGFIVSVNENDLAEAKDSPVFARKKANQMDLLKTVHLANKKNFHSDLSPAVSSSSSIGMDNIAEINVVITESSPMPNKYMASHHSSTPTLSNNKKLGLVDSSLSETNTELSTIIVQSTSANENFTDLDSFQHNSGSIETGMKNLRKSLTLDLQPVGQR